MLRRELRSLSEELDTVVARAFEENQYDPIRFSETLVLGPFFDYPDYRRLYLVKTGSGLVWRFCEECDTNRREAEVEIDGARVIASFDRADYVITISIFTDRFPTPMVIDVIPGRDRRDRATITFFMHIPYLRSRSVRDGKDISLAVDEKAAQEILEWVRRNREAIKNIVYKILSAPADEENIAEIYEKILLDEHTHPRWRMRVLYGIAKLPGIKKT